MKYSTAVLIAQLLMFEIASHTVADEQLQNWKHSGTLSILTTRDGANLPASAIVKEFPLLVRLTKQTFDFSQAQPHGEDVRFSIAQKPLAFQIDTWDSDAGIAAIWVRIPVIRGNDRQQLTMHWGNTDAQTASDGKAVFNNSNGYVVAMHLDGSDAAAVDEIGTVSPVNAGTTPSPGLIGFARQFQPGSGIACGEQLAGLPTGSTSHSTQAWVRAEQINATVVGWGNEQGQGKVVMQIRSPPQVRMDCYFSNADVTSKDRLPMREWVHLVHTYSLGQSQIYINGQLAGQTSRKDSPLNIRNPARMWLGGWYGNYDFQGDIDEVRISAVARSADWVKLEYENQKPLQTLVGTFVQLGDSFTATPEQVILNEGQSTMIRVDAGGAEKLYWHLTQGDDESIVAVDTFSYTLNADRIIGDSTRRLQIKAVYPNGVKSITVPVMVREFIPEPQFTLQSPTHWNGRDTIEVLPVISNRELLHAAGVGQLQTRWTVSGGAVIQQIGPDSLILKRSQFSGLLSIRAEINNGGAANEAVASIVVTEPTTDPWIPRVPENDEKPEQGQFYARDESGEGTLHYNGTLDEPADEVFLRVFADDKIDQTLTAKPDPNKSYKLSANLRAGLIRYRIEFGTRTAGLETVLDRVGDLVCGDAYLIDGQSNALATDTHEESPRETHEWIRSYGGPTGRGPGASWVNQKQKEAAAAGLARPNLWCRPVWKRNSPEHQAELGWWGMELAKRLVQSQKVPVFIINAGVGGTRIDEHQPTSGNHGDLETMYGRMLWRVQQSRLTYQIRAVIWHQGESDQGADGPTGGFGWETYQQYFITMSAAWKSDMPNIRHYYVYQIWPDACAMGGDDGSGDRLREVQRTLPQLYSNMSILSTYGIKPPGGCHFPLEGWSELARMIHPMIERDFYGKQFSESITPPALRSVRYTTQLQDEITLEFDQPILWQEPLIRDFYLDDNAGKVISGSVKNNLLVLKLNESGKATRLTYLKERDWSQDRLLLGTNGLAAMTFCDVTILSADE